MVLGCSRKTPPAVLWRLGHRFRGGFPTGETVRREDHHPDQVIKHFLHSRRVKALKLNLFVRWAWHPSPASWKPVRPALAWAVRSALRPDHAPGSSKLKTLGVPSGVTWSLPHPPGTAPRSSFVSRLLPAPAQSDHLWAPSSLIGFRALLLRSRYNLSSLLAPPPPASPEPPLGKASR